MKKQLDLLGIKKNIFLKNYTTFKIGGPAQYFLETETKESLVKAIKKAQSSGTPFFVLGGGSNVLVSDKGYKGLVLKPRNSKLKIQNRPPALLRNAKRAGNSELETIYAESGVRLGELIKLYLDRALTGFEWIAGIPGTVGGAIKGNTGAFGSSMADVIESVEVLNINDFKTKSFQNSECEFNYRRSVFKTKRNLIILSAILKLKKGAKKEIEKKIQEYLSYRNKTQPLDFPSAGSVFKNPCLYQGGDRQAKKISAGFLIERCGLKGKKIGAAKISEKHANFIVNLGGARAKDVIGLINLVKKTVKERFEIELEEEIEYIGF